MLLVLLRCFPLLTVTWNLRYRTSSAGCIRLHVQFCRMRFAAGRRAILRKISYYLLTSAVEAYSISSITVCAEVGDKARFVYFLGIRITRRSTVVNTFINGSVSFCIFCRCPVSRLSIHLICCCCCRCSCPHRACCSGAIPTNSDNN